jgi:hypothetical protein
MRLVLLCACAGGLMWLGLADVARFVAGLLP